MAGEIEARLKALDLVLPEVALPVADYVSFLHLNSQLFVAGQLPLKDGKLAVTGTLGAGLDIAKGQEAARLCALNILAQAKAALGDLDRIVQCLRLNGFVSSAPGFMDHPKVINGASELIVKVLGPEGTAHPHCRRLREPAAWRGGRNRRHLRGGLAAVAGTRP